MNLILQVPILLYSIGPYFHCQTHPQLGIVSALASLFIPSGVNSPLFSSSILDTCQPGGFIFQCHIFLPFHTLHGVLKARILKQFAIPSPVNHVLSELSTMTHPSCVALQGMAHHSTELDKFVIHVISCSVIVVFIVCPLTGEDKRLVEAS